MGRARWISAALAAVLVACAVHTLPPIQTPFGSALFGSWEWLRSVGGIAGRTETPATRRYKERLVLEPSGFYQVFRHDTLEVSGRYSIRRELTGMRPDSVNVIRWDGRLPLHSAIVELAPDTLRLTDVCVDCYEHTYVRVMAP